MSNSILAIVIFICVILLIFGGFSSKITSYRVLRVIFNYATAPIIGVCILLLTSTIDLNVVFTGIMGTQHIQPYGILILFMSLAYICISIDHTGFFEYLALRTAKGAQNSGKRLFIYFFLITSLLTIFTSNDIVILTLTPIICYFAKYTRTDPVPYIMGQFFAANIWSMMLYVGNPTNIIVAEAYGLSFSDYTVWMFFPTIVAGISCLLLLLVLFRKRIPPRVEMPSIEPRKALRDQFGAIFGVAILATCLVLLSISKWINIDLWIITLICAGTMCLRDVLHDLRRKRYINMKKFPSIGYITERMPWKIIPFIIGMFILVEALVYNGWVDLLASLMTNLSTNIIFSIFLMGFITALTANTMNNQPMTILFTYMLLNPSFIVSSSVRTGSTFALIMGSNFGSNFTLIGSLAGIMWYKILRNQDIKIGFKEFSKYGFTIMPLIMILTFSVFIAQLFILGL